MTFYPTKNDPSSNDRMPQRTAEDEVDDAIETPTVGRGAVLDVGVTLGSIVVVVVVLGVSTAGSVVFDTIVLVLVVDPLVDEALVV